MDLGSILGYGAEASGFGDQFQMAEQLFDSAAPLFQLAGAAAPFVGAICPPAGAACAMAATGAQLAQQLGIGNADENAEQSAKSDQPTTQMARYEAPEPRSEHREVPSRERGEGVRERDTHDRRTDGDAGDRHSDHKVRYHTERRDRDGDCDVRDRERCDARDHRDVRDHRGERPEHRGERPEHRETERRGEADDGLGIQPGDSFLVILAKALAGEIDDKQKKIEEDAKGSDGVADNTLISAETQELAQLVGLANTVISTFGQAEKTAAGQPA